jgi:UDP-N-acetylmuramate--alanine ligase
MSGVAKLLKRAGISVTGSDVETSDATHELERLGIEIFIGHNKQNLPLDCDLVIYSSAVPDSNPERAEARRLDIPQLTNFKFLGEWTKEKKVVLVCGTHGKSTTTALLGLMLEAGGRDPNVIVGSKVPSFPDKNVRFGKSDIYVIEGDEYAKHFLEFEPYAVVLNNIELDHVDVFKDLDAIMDSFRELLSKIRKGGILVANADDKNVQTLIGKERAGLEAREVTIKTFGFGSHATQQILDYSVRSGEQVFALKNIRGLVSRFRLHVPGKMNVMNAAGALSLAFHAGISSEVLQEAVEGFEGIWRRFEKISERDGITVISDYGHHPTAVRATLEATKRFYPGRRVILCFQPHHRNRTKHLFREFVSCFDQADVVLLTEIYDVAGRSEKEDEKISSRDLQEAVLRHDADHMVRRTIEYARDPDSALEILRRWKQEGDIILVMGAGDIYKIAKKVV